MSIQHFRNAFNLLHGSGARESRLLNPVVGYERLKVNTVIRSQLPLVSWLDETAFVHLILANGTTDSICTRCFVTVATAMRETDLNRAEQNHACDSWLVTHWKELAEHDPSEGWDQKPPPARSPWC